MFLITLVNVINNPQAMLIRMFLSCIAFTACFSPEFDEIDAEIRRKERTQERRNKLIWNMSFPPTIINPAFPTKQIIYQQAHSKPSSSKNVFSFAFHEVIHSPICQFTHSTILEPFLFQTVTNIYLALNNLEDHSLTFYNERCEQVSKFHQIEISSILNDRGVSQYGILLFIGKDNRLYRTDESHLLTNLIDLGAINCELQMVGGVARFKSEGKFELFIADAVGVIKVYDEKGSNKINIVLEGFNKRIKQMIDHHPSPLVLSQIGWISTLDTSRYSQIITNCPYFPSIIKLHSNTFFDQNVYVIAQHWLYTIVLHTNRKGCQIKNKVFTLHQIDKLTSQHVHFYENVMLLGEQMINLTDSKDFQINGCEQKIYSQLQHRKGQTEISYHLSSCCSYSSVAESCTLQFSQIKKYSEKKSVLFWVTLCFGMILMLSYKCMKRKSVPMLNYDEELNPKSHKMYEQIHQISAYAKHLA